MRLQIALDGDLASSLAVLRAVRPSIDIAEIGTPLVLREGIAAARKIRAEFPDLTLLADFKIMDAGDEEATIAFEAGCDLVTVLGVTHDATLQGALVAARRFGKQIVVDLVGVRDLSARVGDLLNMGCDYLCIHTAHDVQAAQSPLHDLRQIRATWPDAPLAVAGGINLTTLDSVLELSPAIVVVGSAITKAAKPAEIAQVIHDRISSYDRV